MLNEYQFQRSSIAEDLNESGSTVTEGETDLTAESLGKCNLHFYFQ